MAVPSGLQAIHWPAYFISSCSGKAARFFMNSPIRRANSSSDSGSLMTLLPCPGWLEGVTSRSSRQCNRSHAETSGRGVGRQELHRLSHPAGVPVVLALRPVAVLVRDAELFHQL